MRTLDAGVPRSTLTRHTPHSRSAVVLLPTVVALLAASLSAAPSASATSSTAAAPAAASQSSSTSSAATTASALPAATSTGYVTGSPSPGALPLVAHGSALPILVSAADLGGVVRVVGDLAADIGRVTGTTPAVVKVPVTSSSGASSSSSSAVSSAVASALPAGTRDVVLVGTLGHSPILDALVRQGRLDVRGIAGHWETSLEQVVSDPLPGIAHAFVIAGSDQRGTVYGAYDVSKTIGVSPWTWWDDVPAAQHDALYALPGRHSQGTPAVRYRGFFVNDENPDTGTWAPAYFGPGKADGYPGGLNHLYYAKVFELALRLKANYVWPAVWGRSFWEDDPENQATATAYGIVMGTSHEAPMMRGIEEWNRHAVAAVRDSSGAITTPGHDPYGGTGEWSFRRNADAIQAYWRDGIQRMVDQGIEGVVTLGMRGNGDVSLPDGDGIDLMQNIISNERRILADVTKKDVTTIPQVWTMYKEVLRYWNEGLRPPDDVTVVFTDDNWGNLRRVPDRTLPARSGGYGMYYHFDYVGGGRNYKWVDTANLANTWEQLHEAYSYGVDRLWMANVGDIKNDEEPLQFFLDYAWNPKAVPVQGISAWERGYAAENFGQGSAAAIASVLDEYGQLQARRKPELLNRAISVDPAKDLSTDSSAVVYDDQGNPFSLTAYQEMDRVTAEWQDLAARAERIGTGLPKALQDAYYELVLYQVKATANLYAMRDAEFTELLYARQGRAATNHLADVAEARFADDQAMSNHYNTVLAGGKWAGWQLQPHIDYGDVARYGSNAGWQQPEQNNVALSDVLFPAVQRIEVPAAADLGVAVDGSDQWWPAAQTAAVLPTLSPYRTGPAPYLEIFNRGTTPFRYTVSSVQPWLHVSSTAGTVDQQVRVTVSVDWARAPRGTTRVPITVTGAGNPGVVVTAVVENPTPSSLSGFVEAGGYVAMAADHATRVVGSGGVSWLRLPGIGRTGAGMEPWPVTAPVQTPGSGPYLEYRTTLTSTGPLQITAYLSPRNDVFGGTGLRYAISVDDETPQVVNIATTTGASDATMNRQWERNTSDNVNRTTTTHVVDRPGVHTVRFWMVDPTVVLQELVVNAGGVEPSYLGPPESQRR